MTDTPGLAGGQVAGLVEAAAAGDEVAWEVLVGGFSPMLRAVARRYRIGDTDVDDVVQECWIRLAVHVDELRSPACVAAWLTTTARRLSIEARRRAHRDAWSPTALERPDDAPLPEDVAVRKDAEVRLRAALARLSQRDYLLLSALSTDDRPSYNRVSGLLGLPVGSIGPTRGRALRRLRDELAREEVCKRGIPRQREGRRLEGRRTA